MTDAVAVRSCEPRTPPKSRLRVSGGQVARTSTRKTDARAREAPPAIDRADSGVVSRTGSVLPARAWTSTVAKDAGTITMTIAVPTITEFPNIVAPTFVKL